MQDRNLIEAVDRIDRDKVKCFRHVDAVPDASEIDDGIELVHNTANDKLYLKINGILLSIDNVTRV